MVYTSYFDTVTKSPPRIPWWMSTLMESRPARSLLYRWKDSGTSTVRPETSTSAWYL